MQMHAARRFFLFYFYIFNAPDWQFHTIDAALLINRQNESTVQILEIKVLEEFYVSYI